MRCDRRARSLSTTGRPRDEAETTDRPTDRPTASAIERDVVARDDDASMRDVDRRRSTVDGR